LVPRPAASSFRGADASTPAAIESFGSYATGVTTFSEHDQRGALEAPWTPTDSADLYQMAAWGAGYFVAGKDGHLHVRPDTTAQRQLDLVEVVEAVRKGGHTTPLLVRFRDILDHRLALINAAFSAAISENEYRGRYCAVYPIKVNQQRAVVEEVFRAGSPYGFGLEVGSKPELLAVTAMTDRQPERLIVCNGFKDDAYLHAVMIAAKLGRTIIPVVEKPSELDMILEHAKAVGVRPRIGFRVKLASQGAGRWRDSAGAKSKFGLFLAEVLELFQRLKDQGMEDCLQLVHCHPGSQLQDIRRIKDAVAELAHVYCELSRMGAGLKYLDVGGGLGVDYDGSRTNFASSMNYSIEEYANEVVYRIGSVCDQKGIEHPTIVSESGRAIAAYQSVLVFDVLGSSGLDRFRVPVPPDAEEAAGGDEDLAQPIKDLVEAYRGMTPRRLIECWHDAARAREEAQQLFNLGYLPLEQRSRADELFWASAVKARDLCRRLETVPEELQDLEEILSGTYFCNLSIFQSLPDSWAIGQLFPIMPIHRLDERPTTQAVLADITCDSDGKIDRFVDVRDIKKTLPLHELRPGEPYLLAAFLVGAYQETLGDLHNLFGDPHVVHVVMDEDGSWRIDEFVEGDTVRETLSFVQYDTGVLMDRIARDLERAVADEGMREVEAKRIHAFYAGEFRGFTYLESQRNPAREMQERRP